MIAAARAKIVAAQVRGNQRARATAIKASFVTIESPVRATGSQANLVNRIAVIGIARRVAGAANAGTATLALARRVTAV